MQNPQDISTPTPAPSDGTPVINPPTAYGDQVGVDTLKEPQTTYIRHRDRKDFAGNDIGNLNFEEHGLFTFLRWWLNGYSGWAGYDAITSKDDKGNGHCLPALTWGHRKPDAVGRSYKVMDYMNSYMVLDYDEGDLDPDEFHNHMVATGLHTLWHETLSSGKKKDKDSPPQYKYHVYIETNSIISDVQIFRDHGTELLKEVAAAIGMPDYDKSCKDPARIMYLPVRNIKAGCRWNETQGQPFDILAAIRKVKAEAKAKQNTPPPAPAVVPNNGIGERPAFMKGDADRYSQAVTPVVGTRPTHGGYELGECSPAVQMAAVDNLLSRVPFDGNSQWVSVACAIYNAVGDSGKQLWEHYCKHAIPYDPDKHETQIVSAWKNATTKTHDYNIRPLMDLCKNGAVRSQASRMIKYNDVNATKKTQSHTQAQTTAQPQAAQPQADPTQQVEVSYKDNPQSYFDSILPAPVTDENRLDYLAWEIQIPETHVGVIPEMANGVGTGIRALDRQVGKKGCSEVNDESDLDFATLGVFPTTSSILLGAATGIGKTTAICNLILGMINRKNQPLGNKKNAIVFSLEGSSSMYTAALLSIAQRRCADDPDLKLKLNGFYEDHGKRKVRLSEVADRFSADKIKDEDPDLVLERFYTNSSTRKLTDIILASDPNLGRLAITNTFAPLHPVDIISRVRGIEKNLDITFDIIIVDYIQTLMYDESSGTSEVQGFKNSTKMLTDWCNREQRIPLFATQLVNYNFPEHDKALYLDSIAQSKNIAQMFSHVLLLQQSGYDREYYKRTDLPAEYWEDIQDSYLKRIGVLRVNVAKTRTGGKTMENTECLIGVCQDTLAFTNHVIEPALVTLSDAEYKEKKGASKKSNAKKSNAAPTDNSGTNPAAGDDNDTTEMNPQGL